MIFTLRMHGKLGNGQESKNETLRLIKCLVHSGSRRPLGLDCEGRRELTKEAGPAAQLYQVSLATERILHLVGNPCRVLILSFGYVSRRWCKPIGNEVKDS